MEDGVNIPKVGDVLRAPSGKLRIVRAVHYSGNNRSYVNERRVWVYFVIAHCSWTHRCYTLYSLAELKELGYHHTGKRVQLWRDKFQEKIIRVCDEGTTELTCCDVEGIS
jgi:hypothetical protein